MVSTFLNQPDNQGEDYRTKHSHDSGVDRAALSGETKSAHY